MKIALLSGKGGTGKTFLSVNLACVAQDAVYVDCDVEEPNGHLFFYNKLRSVGMNPPSLSLRGERLGSGSTSRPNTTFFNPFISERTRIEVSIPEVDASKCIGCKTCVDFCKFNALAYVNDRLMIFHELCHSCKGCMLLCPQKALKQGKREIGIIEKGISEHVSVWTGRLNTGEASGVPVIKELIDNLPEKGIAVIDCPPGSACVVMESIRKADYCVLVAEPTLFGAHNLSMVYDLVKLFCKPFGVVLNKCMEEENPSERFCMENNFHILAKIPFEEELGRLNAEGMIAVRESKRYHEMFHKLLEVII